MVLATAGTLLLFNFKSYDDREESYRKVSTLVSILIGAALGFISGIVGIGGGIFLSPISFLIRAGKPIGEPVARGGPFVMNTKQEILKAVQDYHSGNFVQK